MEMLSLMAKEATKKETCRGRGRATEAAEAETQLLLQRNNYYFENRYLSRRIYVCNSKNQYPHSKIH